MYRQPSRFRIQPLNIAALLIIGFDASILPANIRKLESKCPQSPPTVNSQLHWNEKKEWEAQYKGMLLIQTNTIMNITLQYKLEVEVNLHL